MYKWDSRHTLVTGAGGFIGGHLAVALNRAGARVRALCRYNSRGDRGTLGWFDDADTDAIEVLYGDLRDRESVDAALAGVEVAFHLGAQIAIPYSFVNPRSFFETNVGGSLNLALGARDAGVERIVHVSTSEVYGVAQTFPITPECPLAPRSPYAASKAGADMLMQSYASSFALPVVIARPFNAYGPHQSARAIVPTILSQALNGGRVRLGLLTPRRDLTFVGDTVAGLIAIAGASTEPGSTLHIGSGEDISVGALVELVGELVGRELEVEPDTERVRPPASEVPRLLCDYASTTALTGWAPEVALRTGLSATLDWVQANPDRCAPGRYAT